MAVSVKMYGALKDALPRGHKGGITIHASTMAEVRSALEQYLPLSKLMNEYPCEIRYGKTLKSSNVIPAVHAAEILAKGHVDGDFTIHFVPGTGSGDEITTAMIVTALVSAAISIGVTLLMSLLFPPPETDNDSRKSALYNSGLTTQKEGVALSYIAGKRVLCGMNIIEGDVDVTNTGGLATSFTPGPGYNQGAVGGGVSLGGNPGNGKWSLAYQILQAKQLQDSLSGNKSGGGKTIANNSFSEATIKILGALGRGRIGGIYGSTPMEKGQNIFLDEVALVGGNGEFNYQGVDFAERDGSPGQEAIALVGGIPSNFDQNVEIKYKNESGTRMTYPYGVTTADVGYIKARFDLVLVKQDKKGNQSNTNVAISVDTRRVGGSWTNYGTWTFTGKSSEPFQRQIRINAPALNPADPSIKWEFRLQRMTNDSDDDKLNNATKFNGWAEVIEREATYDGADGGEPTALFGAAFDLSQFGSNKPEVAVVCAGAYVRVPSNYVDGHYPNDGSIWDGQFKMAITENPVWHWYNLATQMAGRVGVGLPDTYFNKFNIDAAARYCDQIITYTVGGVTKTRKRHTLNKQFTDDGEAWDELRKLAQSFRAVPYWDGAGIILIQDRPVAASEEASITNILSNADVIDGQFLVTTTSARDRINRVEVEWDNPSDFYRKAVAEYQDDADIAINEANGYSEGGVINQRIYKIGCTDEAEAYAFARELVFDSLNQDETLTFSLPLTGVNMEIGDIIGVDDWLATGRKPVGRVNKFAAGKAYFDGVFTTKNGTRYVVYYTKGDGLPGKTTFTATSDGNINSFNVPSVLKGTSVKIFQESDGVRPTVWRVIAIQEKSPGEYEVTAQKYVFAKYAYIDRNIPVPVTDWTEKSREVAPPTNFRGKSIGYQDDITGAHRDIQLNWNEPVSPAGSAGLLLQGYVVEMLAPGQGVWQEVYRGTNTVFTVRDVQPEVYNFSVKAINTLGKGSAPAVLQFQFGQESTANGRFPPVIVGVNAA